MNPCRPTETDEIHVTPICMRCRRLVADTIIYPPRKGHPEHWKISARCCHRVGTTFIPIHESDIDMRIEFFGFPDDRYHKVIKLESKIEQTDVASLIWENRDK